jgi:UPF0042 nucleotide-binding protein
MNRELWIVTGLSGAGKSLALKCLEDLGFWCVDNLPAQLMRQYMELEGPQLTPHEPMPRALGLRGIEQLEELQEALAQLPDIPIRTRLIYLECDEATLVKRYSETRRRHPLIGSSGRGLMRALRNEREALQGVREKADYLIDTTSLSPHTLMMRLEAIQASLSGRHQPLLAHIQSFGFKNGAPPDAEWVWDVRFLPNPHYIPELKESAGVESSVSEVVFADKAGLELVDRMIENFLEIVRVYASQGRLLVNLAIGCTGGQHRSVATAERVASKCLEAGFVVSVCHRDVRLKPELEGLKAQLMEPNSANARANDRMAMGSH